MVSFLRVTAALLVMAVLLSALAMPVRGLVPEGDITLLEDGRQLHSAGVVAAVTGVALCAGALVIIVWKERRP